jgi:hypothetical protein
MESRPVSTVAVHDYLRMHLCDLYENDCIFDKFECAASADGKQFLTGSYNNNFLLHDSVINQSITIEAQKDPVALPTSTAKEKGKDKKKKEKSDSVYVAKISMDPRDNENRAIYFRDVEMQTVAKYYADQFNEYNPPKKVDFVKAWLLKLEDRQGKPLCGVERFIEGSYRKHNNNFGYVSEDDRNTPQAFSHFTYEASNHQMLVCDIQGVSDLYTDPQLHCVDNKHNFGKGNLGQRGIDRFLQTHRCNVICRYLKLPEVNANYDEDNGTLPLTQYMSCEQVGNVDVAIFQKESTGGLGPLEPLLTPPKEPEAKCCCVMQ